MERAIAAALFLIATVIASVAVMNTVIPAVGRGSSAMIASSAGASSRIKTEVKIVFATGATSTDQVTFWVKNVGREKIKAIDKSDLFLTTPTEVKRIPYNSGAENWTYTVENGTDWVEGITIKATVTLTTVTEGLYSISFSKRLELRRGG